MLRVGSSALALRQQALAPGRRSERESGGRGRVEHGERRRHGRGLAGEDLQRRVWRQGRVLRGRGHERAREGEAEGGPHRDLRRDLDLRRAGAGHRQGELPHDG